jgi:hypothetical protein
LILNKKNTNIKIPELIRGEKGVEENLPFTRDSVETENRNKEVLEHQLVTTYRSQDKKVRRRKC